MGEFRMPVLGADMEAGTIVEWRVAVGDAVRHGDIIAVVDTDKSTIEVEVFEDGVVEELLVPPGVEVPVGTPLARLRGPGAPAEPAMVTAPATAAPVEAGPARLGERPTDEVFVRASPMARRDAAVAGVDLVELVGSGPGGAVVARDVATAAASRPPEPGAPEVVPETRSAEAPRRRAEMRRAVGALMARSAREIPHYYLATTVDLGATTEWLRETNAQRPVAARVLPAAVLFRAVAVAARQVPVMNGVWTDAFVPSEAVHLGVAVSLRGGGLIAPAIRDADQMGVDELMASLRAVVQRARAGILRSSDFTDPTITVTNLGDQGVDEVYGVIYPPQVALVGFGRVVDRPWAKDGLLGVRPVVRATLAADHRASDGIEGARFLAAIEHLLQSPEDL